MIALEIGSALLPTTLVSKLFFKVTRYSPNDPSKDFNIAGGNVNCPPITILILLVVGS